MNQGRHKATSRSIEQMYYFLFDTGLLRDFDVTLGNDIITPTNNAIISTFTGFKAPGDTFYHNYYPYKYGRVLGILRNGGDYINRLQIAEVVVVGASVTGT